MKNLLLPALAGIALIFAFAPPAAANQPYCREYTKTVSINGRTELSYGTACMQPDGSWREGPPPSVYQFGDNTRLVVTEGTPVYRFDDRKRHKYKYYRNDHHGPRYFGRRDGKRHDHGSHGYHYYYRND